MEIFDNKEIIIQGITGLDKTNWMFNIEGKDEFKIWRDVRPNNTYGETITLKNNLREGDYKIGVYFKDKNDSSYWSYYWNIPFKFEDGEMFFPISPVYQNNYLKSKINSVIDPADYLDVILDIESESKEISELANDITKDIKSDYEKTLKISEWVS